MMPRFSAPSGRRAVRARVIGGVIPMATPNTCGCSGDQTYNKCSVSRNDCDPGFYPSCNEGPYNCGCTCLPA